MPDVDIDFDEALNAAEHQDIFGKDRYFLELMDHGIEIEHRVRQGLLDIGKKPGIPPLVTKNLFDPDRFKFDGTGYYLKSTDEMYAIDSSDAWQEGCANTLLVAEMVDTTGMFEAKNLMPKFDIPEGYTEVTWFKEEVRRGMERRFPGGIPDDRQKQAEYEMDVIIQMGFPGYFLIVADFIMRAKNNDISTKVSVDVLDDTNNRTTKAMPADVLGEDIPLSGTTSPSHLSLLEGGRDPGHRHKRAPRRSGPPDAPRRPGRQLRGPRGGDPPSTTAPALWAPRPWRRPVSGRALRRPTRRRRPAPDCSPMGIARPAVPGPPP